jgi:hypothetical protein
VLGSGGVLGNKYLFSAQKIAQVQVRDGTGFLVEIEKVFVGKGSLYVTFECLLFSFIGYICLSFWAAVSKVSGA